MACKITDDPSAAVNISWRSISAGSVSAPSPAQELQKSTGPSMTVQQLAELERAKQFELAECRKAALQEGIKKGREESLTEIKSANERLGQTLRDLSVLKSRIRSEAEADVVKLSLAVARRVLRRELATDPESVCGIVHAALGKIQNREISRVRVSPAATEAVRVALEKAGASPAIAITPDPCMQTGDIVFETAIGELDASVETQLQEIERGFADRLGLKR